MNLTIMKKLQLKGILPEKGGLSDQLIAKDIAAKVAISPEDLEAIEFDKKTGTINPEKDVEKPVEFSSAEIQLLKGVVDDLDREKNITSQLVDLCVEIKGT